MSAPKLTKSERFRKAISETSDDALLYLPNEIITAKEAKRRLYLRQLLTHDAPDPRHTKDDSIVLEEDDDNKPPPELIDSP